MFERACEPVRVTTVLSMVMLLRVRVSPVENVSGTSYADAFVKAAVPSVPPVPMLSVLPSVPTRVSVLFRVSVLDKVPPAIEKPVAFDV